MYIYLSVIIHVIYRDRIRITVITVDCQSSVIPCGECLFYGLRTHLSVFFIHFSFHIFSSCFDFSFFIKHTILVPAHDVAVATYTKTSYNFYIKVRTKICCICMQHNQILMYRGDHMNCDINEIKNSIFSTGSKRAIFPA